MKIVASIIVFLTFSIVSFAQEATKTVETESTETEQTAQPSSTGAVTPATKEQNARLREALPATLVRSRAVQPEKKPEPVIIPTEAVEPK